MTTERPAANRDESFDLVTSRAAIHNLYAAADRATAIAEIARVMKPGGYALAADIRPHREYARTFALHRCGESRLTASRLVSTPLAAITFGSLTRNTLQVRKSP